MSDLTPSASASPAEKIKAFPTGPGLYLLKDAQGRVLYIAELRAGRWAVVEEWVDEALLTPA